jgi:hypothetical protein
MLPKLMNKWMFTRVNTVVSLFIMLPYARLSSHSTGHMQISNDAKLNMTDGAYKDFRGAEP